MSKPVNVPNHQRRRLMQGTVLSATAMVMPGLVNAACGAGNHKLVQTIERNSTNVLTNDDVSIKLVESNLELKNGTLARVTITNKSDQAIKLSHVSPGAISTQKGVYQLNAKLANNPIAVRPGGVYQFWLGPDDGTQALLSSKPKVMPGDIKTSAALEVSVVTETNSGTWYGTQRVQAVI